MTARSRRSVILGAATAAANAVLARAAEQPPLKKIAADRGILFGSAVDYPDSPVYLESNISDLYSRECALLVTGYQMLWSQNEASQGALSFARADRFFRFGSERGAKLAGHPIVWNEFTPDWANEIYIHEGRANAERLLKGHVTDLVSHFRGKFSFWNVVNECLDVQGQGKNGLKNAPVFNTLGTESLDIAFNAAHRADPDAILTLNEVDLEMPFPNNELKRSNALRLIEGMKKRNVPIHALGLQSHLRSQYGFKSQQVRAFLAEVSGLGLKIHITELDVDDRQFPKDFRLRDAACAALVKEYLDVVLDQKNVDMLVTWGLIDKYSWLNLPGEPVPKMDQYDMRNFRKDGTAHRPLPFDDSLQPTAVFQGIVAALSNARARP